MQLPLKTFLLLLVVALTAAQDSLSLEDVAGIELPDTDSKSEALLRDDEPIVEDSETDQKESQESREGKQIPFLATPAGPAVGHIHPAVPHPPAHLVPGIPQAAIFRDSPVVHVEALPHPHLVEPVYTDRKCRIEQVELVAEVCLPTIEKDCAPVALKQRVVTGQEKCVEVARTVCTESEESVDNELCYYKYVEGEVEGEVTSVEVEYELECEDQPQHYGAYGKDKSQVCYNKPVLSKATTPLTLEVPQPEKKCTNKPVVLPRVDCQEVKEERCFQLPVQREESATLEKCSTRLGPPKCRQVPIKLPRQVCSRVVPAPPPPPPAPHHYAAPAPHYAAPHHAVHHGLGHGLGQPLQHHGLAAGPAHGFAAGAAHGFVNLSG